LAFRISGARSYQGDPVQGWRINFGALNVQMNDLGRFIAAYHRQGDQAGREAWRHTAQEIGMHLYTGLLNTDSTLAQYLGAVLRRTHPAENLTLVFEGPRDYLSVPYELLHDGHTPLALRFPICRRMAGVLPGSSADFYTFIETLKAAGRPLKVLLISSGARSVAADQEIEFLETSFQDHARRAGLNADIEVVWAGAASYEALKQKLAQCPYHVVHYAGQVYHDRLNPDNGGLLFADRRDEQVGQALLTIRDLAGWLRGSATQLFFISACVGPQHWDEYVLRDSHYLGLIAALAEAGVPYVIGFRWYVTYEGRQRFVQRFYERLFYTPFAPERAMLAARQAVFRRDSQDETWASPILIAQNIQDRTR
jgi:hypothetical protein